MSRLVFRPTLLLILTLISASVRLLCQVQNGEFTGTVVDPTGALIAQAKFSIRNVQTGLTTEVLSNEFGIYTARELIVGSYTISVSKPGFRTATANLLTLNAGTVVRMDFRLQVGPQTDVVDV